MARRQREAHREWGLPLRPDTDTQTLVAPRARPDRQRISQPRRLDTPARRQHQHLPQPLRRPGGPSRGRTAPGPLAAPAARPRPAPAVALAREGRATPPLARLPLRPQRRARAGWTPCWLAARPNDKTLSGSRCRSERMRDCARRRRGRRGRQQRHAGRGAPDVLVPPCQWPSRSRHSPLQLLPLPLPRPRSRTPALPSRHASRTQQRRRFPATHSVALPQPSPPLPATLSESTTSARRVTQPARAAHPNRETHFPTHTSRPRRRLLRPLARLPLLPLPAHRRQLRPQLRQQLHRALRRRGTRSPRRTLRREQVAVRRPPTRTARWSRGC